MSPKRNDIRGEDGFTLAEALAAMLFLAVVLPVLVQAFLTADRTAVAAERSRLASELAAQRLNELVVTDEWRDDYRDGDFGEDYPGYRWAVSDDGWQEDTMRVVAVEVYYEVQGHEQSVRVATLVREDET